MQDVSVAIHDLDEVFMQGVREKKARELTESFYVEDGEVLPPNRPSVIGRVKIAEFWQSMFEAGLCKAILNTTHIDVSGEAAYVKGQYAFTFQQDGEVGFDKGKYMKAYRRQRDGQWQVEAEIFNSDKEMVCVRGLRSG